ncbi:hypothetical protein K0M31_006168 [Melipona bicolor]|uniref:Uncharacterized protein n=1 Tax=Melipona bicolor TaxID=60889 RepID=A0AA40FT17_9HYME|nr:hypothetical protein K0M31_006168 [Melipona bicolor]
MEMFQFPVFCLILIQVFLGPAAELAASEPEGEESPPYPLYSFKHFASPIITL